MQTRREDCIMCQIAIDIPNEVLYDTRMSKSDARDFAKKAVALRYYVKNGVSLGYCAEIAGMSKDAFIRFLGENNISIFCYDDQEEFLEELENA